MIGFLLALLLTFLAYYSNSTPWIFALGLLQGIILLITFLGLGIEPKPRWNLLAFFFMVFVIIILVGGSMWIMYNLNYNMMPSGMKMHK